MPFAPARWNGETAPTVHTRSSRPWESRLICTASRTTCSRITPVRSISDLCREGMPAIFVSTLNCPTGLRPIQTARAGHKNFNYTNEPLLVDANLPQQPEIAQHLSCAQYHGSEWVVRDRNRQARLFPDTLVQIFQQRAAGRAQDTAVADIRRKLGRGAFQRYADRIQDRRNAFGQGLANFAVIDCDSPRPSLNGVPPFHFHGQRLLQRVRGADFHFDLFRGPLTD